MPHRTHDTTLIEVRGDLVLAALCVGQFRAPCQIEADRLIVRAGEPLTQALNALGLVLSAAEADPFTPAPLFAPEGGHAGRHVHTHISRYHDDEAADEDDSRGSNA
ncbi:hypothetical protein O5O51_08750 [Sinirhodobacter sp. HNIBRBA609]|nr:hypothetical protein O5O51_08750 [Sinirhodobacter sp. HNIBRBA609]